MDDETAMSIAVATVIAYALITSKDYPIDEVGAIALQIANGIIKGAKK